MRVYHKGSTHHPYCIYLTAEEAHELTVEAEIAEEHSADVPLLVRLAPRLIKAMGLPEGGRA